ncbi:hypothetical protein J7643_14290 [bacterium]|nr:hypothetical protein [bacterium]
MRLKQYLRWELLLALSLVGCTAAIPNRLGGEAGAPGAAGTRLAEPVAQGGSLYFQIRWPGPRLSTQAVQFNPDAVKVFVKKADGTAIQSQVLTRPTDGTFVRTARFTLDPALKQVDVFAEAWQADKLLAKGKHLAVPVRDNTSTPVAIALDLVDQNGNQTGLDLRLAPELAMLHSLPELAARYSNLRTYGTSPEFLEIKAALDATIARLFGDRRDERAPSPSPTVAAAPYRVQSLENPSFRLIDAPFQAVDLVDGVPSVLYWPGFQGAYSFSGGSTGLHTLDLAVTPAGQDLTTANLHGELDADAWVSEPNLMPIAKGYEPGATEVSTRSVALLGGMRPDFKTLRQGKLHLDVAPGGMAARGAALDLALDQVRDVSSTAFYQFLQSKVQSSLPTANWPSHAALVAQTPTLAATADIKAADDFLGGQLKSIWRLLDKDGKPGHYDLALGVQERLGTVNGKPEIAGADVAFALDDVALGLRLKGLAHVETSPPKVTIQASFVDIASNLVLGTLNYEVPIDSLGRVDFSRLASWPVLTVADPTKPDAPKTSYRLTPGFFSGDVDGTIQVEVR